MSVPSHNLYDYIHQVLERRYWLLYYYPWGSRDLFDAVAHQTDVTVLDRLTSLDDDHLVAKRIFGKDINLGRIADYQPVVFCHDQEPLNFNLYLDHQPTLEKIFQWQEKGNLPNIPGNNIRHRNPMSCQKKWILLHSELNSHELIKYEQTGRYVGAFWWSHAPIARDWYRYAEFDPSLKYKQKSEKIFLIYSRESSGTRLYRDGFINQITQDDLIRHCQIGSFHDYDIGSDASAGYDARDFVKTDISLVLETIFTDNRIHLTEKILRPIACGHPFILAAGPKSLEFLRFYGFQTFDPWIDESYDLELDHVKRKDLIINEMKRISLLPDQAKSDLLRSCQEIARHNQSVFFSDRFLDHVTQELKYNVQGIKMENYGVDPDLIRANWEYRKKHLDTMTVDSQKPYIEPLLEWFDQGKSLEQYQRHQHSLDDKSSTDGDNV